MVFPITEREAAVWSALTDHADLRGGEIAIDATPRAPAPLVSGGLLLLTGATGLVGRAFLECLRASSPECSVAALVRRPEHAASLHGTGVHVLVGDISSPMLGLDVLQYERLRLHLTAIVHFAAVVRFNLPLSSARAVNVVGTQQVLDLARQCPKLQCFIQISTTYVNGLCEGELWERPCPRAPAYANSYQQSKHEAEELVLAAMDDIPAAIYRLSLVAADSANGRVSQFNYLHQLIRWLPDGPLLCVPGDPSVKIDMITADWAAAAIGHVFENFFRPGTVRHFCAGPEASLTLGEIFTLAAKTVEESRLGGGAPVRMPEFVSVSQFEKYASQCRDADTRKVLLGLRRNLPLMAVRQVFRNPLAAAELKASGLTLPEMRNFYIRVVQHCYHPEWGAESHSNAADASNA